MNFDLEDTIVAIASASGGAPRGIVRISGNNALGIVKNLFVADSGDWDFKRSTMIRGRIEFPFENLDDIPQTVPDDRTLDVPVQLLIWPDSRSYTAQPSVEVHTIGANPILEHLVQQLCDQGARMARPGEFTLRAFLGGRLDLTQAEAVLAVIDADNERQFEVALGQLAGGLAGPLGDVRQKLVSVLADLEAGLDFVEEDISFISSEKLTSDLISCQRTIQQVVQQIENRDISGALPSMVLIGQPNAGKSQLFNCLSNSEQVIVTNVAGTTTDFVEATIKLNSMRVKLIDTAGEESATGEISMEAQRIQSEQKSRAALRLMCVEFDPDLQVLYCNVVAQLERVEGLAVLVVTKIDRCEVEADQFLDQLRDRLQTSSFCEIPLVATSGLSKSGVDELKTVVETIFSDHSSSSETIVASTVQRASTSLRRADALMAQALTAVEQSAGDEIVAAEIREALIGLAEVVGEVYTDDILDVVFGRFCIGK